jgi:hypothetical protein
MLIFVGRFRKGPRGIKKRIKKGKVSFNKILYGIDYCNRVAN